MDQLGQHSVRAVHRESRLTTNPIIISFFLKYFKNVFHNYLSFTLFAARMARYLAACVYGSISFPNLCNVACKPEGQLVLAVHCVLLHRGLTVESKRMLRIYSGSTTEI